MLLTEMKMKDINQIATVNEDTVSFMYKGNISAMLHRADPRFVLIMDDTFTEDREASPEETKLIDRIFNVAGLALELA